MGKIVKKDTHFHNLKVLNEQVGNLSVSNHFEFPVIVDSNNSPCVIMNFIADEVINANSILKVGVNAFTVAMMKTVDNVVPVVGVSMNSANAGGVVKVCVNGVFKVKISSLVSVGDKLERSTVVNGQTQKELGGGTNTFAVALQSGIVGDVISAISQRAELF